MQTAGGTDSADVANQGRPPEGHDGAGRYCHAMDMIGQDLLVDLTRIGQHLGLDLGDGLAAAPR